MNGQIPLDTLSHEELLRVAIRDRFVKELLTSRVASILLENMELVALCQEQQNDLLALRQGEQMAAQAEQFGGNGPQPGAHLSHGAPQH